MNFLHQLTSHTLTCCLNVSCLPKHNAQAHSAILVPRFLFDFAAGNRITTQSLWTTREQSQHINELELRAIKFVLKAFEQKLSGKHVKILSDNTTAVCHINSKGGTKSPSCNNITCDIWSWWIKNSTWHIAAHIPGAQNTAADRESRIFNECTEWRLNPDVFSQIRNLWVNPEIDLFATRVNTQLAMFASWKPDPEATHIDAFTID